MSIFILCDCLQRGWNNEEKINKSTNIIISVILNLRDLMNIFKKSTLVIFKNKKGRCRIHSNSMVINVSYKTCHYLSVLNSVMTLSACLIFVL